MWPPGTLIGGGGNWHSKVGGELLDHVVECLLEAFALLPPGIRGEFGRVGYATPHVLKAIRIRFLIGDKGNAVVQDPHVLYCSRRLRQRHNPRNGIFDVQKTVRLLAITIYLQFITTHGALDKAGYDHAIMAYLARAYRIKKPEIISMFRDIGHRFTAEPVQGFLSLRRKGYRTCSSSDEEASSVLIRFKRPDSALQPMTSDIGTACAKSCRLCV